MRVYRYPKGLLIALLSGEGLPVLPIIIRVPGRSTDSSKSGKTLLKMEKNLQLRRYAVYFYREDGAAGSRADTNETLPALKKKSRIRV